MRSFVLSLSSVLGAIALLFSLEAGLLTRSFGQKPEYPAPRYPKIPKITSVEELLPYARYIVSKPRDRSNVMRPGYGIKGGEKVLVLVNSTVDPLVLEAFFRAFKEKNCVVDQLIMDNAAFTPSLPDGATEARLAASVRPTSGGFFGVQAGKWLEELVKERGYQLVIGPSSVVGQQPKDYLVQRMHWVTRELLASPATTFPEELIDAIDRKAWEILRQAREVRITDPEGTDLRFTWFPEYWEVVEGTHPTIKTVGGGPASGISGYQYGAAGSSEHPLIPGHVMGYPEGIVLPQSNAEGVVAGTSNHSGPYPHIKLRLKGNRIVEVEGGGEFGRLLLTEFLEKYKNVRLPMYPGPGLGWLVEAAVGTNPKIIRPHNVAQPLRNKGLWVFERMRSGIIHMGFGNFLHESATWAAARGLPNYHVHTHLYFPTFTVTMSDGREVKLIDRGRLAPLDDPEVRKVAAKYGNPDELLREDWIPAIPGINVPGDYWKDYANDPISWIVKEHERAYKDIWDFRPYW